MKTGREHLYKRGDRIKDSLQNKRSISLYYIYLRTQLNQFEMFVLLLIHKITLNTVIFYEKVLGENHIKIENESLYITIQQ